MKATIYKHGEKPAEIVLLLGFIVFVAL